MIENIKKSFEKPGPNDFWFIQVLLQTLQPQPLPPAPGVLLLYRGLLPQLPHGARVQVRRLEQYGAQGLGPRGGG